MHQVNREGLKLIHTSSCLVLLLFPTTCWPESPVRPPTVCKPGGSCVQLLDCKANVRKHSKKRLFVHFVKIYRMHSNGDGYSLLRKLCMTTIMYGIQQQKLLCLGGERAVGGGGSRFSSHPNPHGMGRGVKSRGRGVIS